MSDDQNQHKVWGIESRRKDNTYVNMNNSDDDLESSTGDNDSLMMVDSPDDFPDEGK